MTYSFSPALSRPPYLKLDQEHCPWCEQRIPHGKFDEISARIAAAEQSKLAEQEAALKQHFAQERQQLAERARHAIEEERSNAGAALVEVAAKHRMELEAATARAEASVTARLRIVQEQADARIALAETARLAAEEAAIERIRAFEAERGALAQQLLDARQAHESEVALRTSEVREKLSQEMSKAVLDVKASAFAERQKLTAAVDDLKRQLEKKSASELGEGAEIDLFETLGKAFEGDAIRRVPKGENGADIVHDIVEHGIVCGRIVYDSKNRSSWQSNFVPKLHSDMLAAQADHAILSTNRFPAGTRQLHVAGGVIIASPARVVAVVELLRSHILQAHALRVSAEQREEKTLALYDYIVSDRYTRLMESLQSLFERLGTIDSDERRVHETVWNKRGKVLRDLDRTRGTVAMELQRILGMEETPAQAKADPP